MNYKNNNDLMQEIILVCNNSNSMTDAYNKLTYQINLKTFIKYAKQLGVYKPNQSGKGQKKSLNDKISLEQIFNNEVYFQSHKLKLRLFKEGIKKEECECCKNKIWLGKPIPLELHHKDGNKRNNDLNNLEILCPNCHAMTDTYRAKNIKSEQEIINNKPKQIFYCPICGNEKSQNAKNCKQCSNKLKKQNKLMTKVNPINLSREQFKYEIRNNTFVALSKKYNVSRNIIKNWCKFFNLPQTRNDILNYSDDEWLKI